MYTRLGELPFACHRESASSPGFLSIWAIIQGSLCLPAQMALGLSSEQKERLLAARSYLLAQMMEIISERTAIINMLQACPRLFDLPTCFDACLPVVQPPSFDL